MDPKTVESLRTMVSKRQIEREVFKKKKKKGGKRHIATRRTRILRSQLRAAKPGRCERRTETHDGTIVPWQLWQDDQGDHTLCDRGS